MKPKGTLLQHFWWPKVVLEALFHRGSHGMLEKFLNFDVLCESMDADNTCIKQV